MLVGYVLKISKKKNKSCSASLFRADTLWVFGFIGPVIQKK